MIGASNYIANAIFALIEWGKIRLLRPDLEEYLKDVQSDFNIFVEKSGKNIAEIIHGAIEETELMVEEAKKVLSSREFIGTAEGEEIWYKAKDALNAFDRVIFLNKAITELINDFVKEEAIKHLDNIMLDIFFWFDDSEWSALRLTAINNYRKEILKKIPEEHRYLFPWYEVFVEYGEDLIEVLIQNYNDILEGKIENLPITLQNNLGEVLFELFKDEELLFTIKQQHILHKKILEVYSQRNSLTLWRLSEKAALDYHISTEVANIGLIRISTHIIQTALQKMSSEAEKVYWMFLSAFCGPDLDDNQRLQLLDVVEKKIGNINVQNINGEVGRVLALLKQWFEGKNNDMWLVSAAYETWNKMLQEEAKKFGAREFETDEEVEAFWQALESLKNKIIWNVGSLIDLLASKFWPSPTIKYRPAETMDEEKEKSLQIFQKNPLKITVYPDDQGNYAILPPPGLVYSDNLDHYKDLYKLIATSSGIYCGGLLIKEKGKEILPLVELNVTTKQFYWVKDNEYTAIIGFSDDINLIEKFVSIISSEKLDLQTIEDKTLNLLLLIISFETRGAL